MKTYMAQKNRKAYFLTILFILAFFVVGNAKAACEAEQTAAHDACQTHTDPSQDDPTCGPKTTAYTNCNNAATACASTCVAPKVCNASNVCEAAAPTPTPTPSGGTTFTNPLTFNTVEELLTSVLTTMRQIIVLLALVFLVIGSLIYITSAGESGRIETAKKAITAAMIGLAIGIAAPSFLKEIGTVLGWNSVNSAAVTAAPTLSAIATKVLTFLLSILGTIALIMLIIGSMMYLTSAGDDERIETGKKIFKYSLIGIIIAMGSLVLVKQIAAFFV